MKVCINDMLHVFAFVLDNVEKEIVGVVTNHAERIAYVCTKLGRQFGFNEYELSDLSACAILHDSAILEYIEEEHCAESGIKAKNKRGKKGHCIVGEQNIKNFPFYGSIENVILYHHENFDGSGPFGKKKAEIPLYSALIHMADDLDVKFGLYDMDDVKYDAIQKHLAEYTDKHYAKVHVDAFLSLFTKEEISKMNQDRIEEALARSLVCYYREYSPEDLIAFSTVFAKLIDYKSGFTGRHSHEIAKKAAFMGRFYGFDKEEQAKLYLAGALHDIGKLVVDSDILEKPDKLTEDEYIYVQTHAYYTYAILKKVRGFEEITRWAALHHEKLNGKGYPFGLTAKDLKFNERLMGCLDIYQALVEERPYKKVYSHEEAIAILRKMGSSGYIDKNITEDINEAFGKNQGQYSKEA